MQKPKVSPISSGYGSEISSGSITSSGGTRSARVFKTRPNSIGSLNGSRRTIPTARGTTAARMRGKSEKIRRAEDTKGAMAKAVLPAKLATFLGIFALVTEFLVSAFEFSYWINPHYK